MLTELARQVALALHNLQLDAALQASLEELQRRNEELQHSRARIVAAGDAERRKLERNLHDGAQQHLVALAVKLRLAKDAVEDDPADALAMIDEIKGDLQAAITELRSLAHGIFPRCSCREGWPRRCRRQRPGRLSPPRSTRRVSAAMAPTWKRRCTSASSRRCKTPANTPARRRRSPYGCGRHDGVLGFEVSDDGAGFDTTSATGDGHGFVNMADRLGAFGGTVTMRSQPGKGTTVAGTLPFAS